MANRDMKVRHIREQLQKRRRDLLRSHEGTKAELQALKNADRDPEYEEGAQTELADYTLSKVIENQRRELLLIDAAFQRMDQGVYGFCVDCGADIGFDRLAVVPFAIRCEEDARMHEQSRLGAEPVAPSL